MQASKQVSNAITQRAARSYAYARKMSANYRDAYEDVDICSYVCNDNIVDEVRKRNAVNSY